MIERIYYRVRVTDYDPAKAVEITREEMLKQLEHHFRNAGSVMMEIENGASIATSFYFYFMREENR